MNELLIRCGLSDWRGIYSPDEARTRVKQGEVLPCDQTVVVYDSDESKVLEITSHEATEVLLRRLLSSYRSVINHLITLIEDLLNKEKEHACDRIGALLLKAFGEDEHILRTGQSSISGRGQPTAENTGLPSPQPDDLEESQDAPPGDARFRNKAEDE